MARRGSHIVPTTNPGSHSRKNSTNAAPRIKKRTSSIIPSDDLTTLPLLELPASIHRSDASSPPNGGARSTWITPRLNDELLKNNATDGVLGKTFGTLSLEKSLELLQKILTEGRSPPKDHQIRFTTPPVIASSPMPPPPRLGETERKASVQAISAPQRIEELYDTITILRQELDMERAQNRANDSGTTGLTAYSMDTGGDSYYSALGRNAELHIRAKKFESAANSMREDLEASKLDQKKTLDHVNSREEKLRNVIKKNKCLMAEYEVLKDQYVEEKVKSVEVYRTMTLDKKRHDAVREEHAELETKIDAMATAHAAEVKGLQTALETTQAERDRLVLCVAESRHRFRAWKDREAKSELATREQAKEGLQLEHAIRMEKFQNEIRLLREKVTQLEQSNQMLKREPHLSPLELTQRKHQLLNTITTQEADLIGMTTRIQELETMLAFAKSQQEQQGAMLRTAQEAMANMLHDREVQALEHLSWNATPPRTPSTAPMSPTSHLVSRGSVFPMKSPTSPASQLTPRAPSSAPSPRVQQSKRKGQYRKADSPQPLSPAPPQSITPTLPSTPPSSAPSEQNLTVSSWKQEVRGLTEQVEEYKAMIVSLSSEIDKLKTERKKVAVQKQTDLQHQAELDATKRQLAQAKINEQELSNALEKYRLHEVNKAAQLIQIKTRGAVARYKLKAKLKATRILQAQLRGFAARKRTNLCRLSAISVRDERRMQSAPTKVTEDQDVYVEYLSVPPCVKVEMWYNGQLLTKYIPNRSLPLYVTNGAKMLDKACDELQVALANLVEYDDTSHMLVLPLLPPEDLVAKAQDEAAEKIQARVKGFIVRRELSDERERRRIAAETIQSHAKGYFARKTYGRKAEAVVQIQAQAKGYIIRRRYRRQKEALEKIQATAKGSLERKAYEHKRASIAKIQAQSKGYIARRTYGAKKEAAVRIQATAKGRMRRQSYLDYQEKSKAAKSIQARTKGFLARKEITEKQNSAIKIQSHFKGHSIRRDRRRKAESATRIQSARRAYIEKQAFIVKRQAICKIQAGIKGFYDRQRICIMPRRQRLNELDETRADHRFRRNVESNLVEFRIHCLDNPPCVKIEALLHKHVYSTFVKYQDINNFVGFGMELYHENPETLAKTIEPLLSLVPSDGPYGYRVVIKKTWDMMDSVRKLSLTLDQENDLQEIARAHAMAAKVAAEIGLLSAQLREELYVPEVIGMAKFDVEPAEDIGTPVKAKSGIGEQPQPPTTSPSNVAVQLDGSPEPTSNASVAGSVLDVPPSTEYTEYFGDSISAVAVLLPLSSDPAIDSDKGAEQFDASGNQHNVPPNDDDSDEAKASSDSEAEEVAATTPVEIPMWLVNLDMEEEADFKTILCAVDEAIEHLSPHSSEANLRYSITHGYSMVESMNALPVIYGICSHDLFDETTKQAAATDQNLRKSVAESWANRILQDAMESFASQHPQQPRRQSTNLEELVLDMDNLNGSTTKQLLDDHHFVCEVVQQVVTEAVAKVAHRTPSGERSTFPILLPKVDAHEALQQTQPTDPDVQPGDLPDTNLCYCNLPFQLVMSLPPTSSSRAALPITHRLVGAENYDDWFLELTSIILPGEALDSMATQCTEVEAVWSMKGLIRAFRVLDSDVRRIRHHLDAAANIQPRTTPPPPLTLDTHKVVGAALTEWLSINRSTNEVLAKAIRADIESKLKAESAAVSRACALVQASLSDTVRRDIAAANLEKCAHCIISKLRGKYCSEEQKHATAI
ncbi:hypothetical protein DYB26_001910, partial [Aphanomyces astaci]